MNTFLIILAILFGLVVVAVVTGALFLRKMVAKGAVFVLRKATEHALSRTEPEWVPAAVRAELSAINADALALPAVGLFNGNSVLLQAKDLTLRLAAELEKLEAAAPEPITEPAPEPAALPAVADASASPSSPATAAPSAPAAPEPGASESTH